MKLNLGCGKNKIEGAINVDVEKSCNPDLVADFISGLPFATNSVDVVYLFHVIEHIPERQHNHLLCEISRVLKTGGMVFISYPEFIQVAQNYINNHLGKRDFWKATIYGRQLYPSDTHVSLMDTRFFRQRLANCGFSEIRSAAEHEPWNTVVKAIKGNPCTYEDELTKVVFNGSKAL